MLNFSKYGEQQILGWNLPPKFMNEYDEYFLKKFMNTSKHYTSKSESAYKNMPFYQISINL